MRPDVTDDAASRVRVGMLRHQGGYRLGQRLVRIAGSSVVVPVMRRTLAGMPIADPAAEHVHREVVVRTERLVHRRAAGAHGAAFVGVLDVEVQHVGLGHDYAFSAAGTRAAVNGTRRRRTPVASNTALATAACAGLHTIPAATPLHGL